MSSSQDAQKTRVNFPAERAQQPGRLGAWVPVYASAGIPWAPSPQGREVSAIMCKTAGHPTRRKFSPRASKNHRGGHVCPQACAVVRKRTWAGGSLPRPPAWKSFRQGCARPQAPSNAKKIPTSGFQERLQQAPGAAREAAGATAAPADYPAMPTPGRAQQATGAAGEATETTATRADLPVCPRPEGRSVLKERPRRPQGPPLPR